MSIEQVTTHKSTIAMYVPYVEIMLVAIAQYWSSQSASQHKKGDVEMTAILIASNIRTPKSPLLSLMVTSVYVLASYLLSVAVIPRICPPFYLFALF